MDVSEVTGIQISIQTIEGDLIIENLFYGFNFIGRNSEVYSGDGHFINIHTRDNKISRKHCCLKLIQKESYVAIELFDSNSTNGTFLVGFRSVSLSSYDIIYVEENDIILIGDCKIKIKVRENAKLLKSSMQKPILEKKKTLVLPFNN
jgi:pSer/pThr/pTyr-binding forkhead associated (FHA) protein